MRPSGGREKGSQSEGGTTVTEQTTAEIIEPTEAIELVVSMHPGSAIEANFDALEKYITEMTEPYRGLVIEEDYVPQAKRERAWLNNQAKSLDQKRKDVEAAYRAPFVPFELRAKEIIGLIKSASQGIDVQIKDFEARAKEAKREEIRKHYEDFAGVLVEAVPFDRIEDPKWLNSTVNLMTAFKEVEQIVERIAADEATLTELNLAHPEDAKAEFFRTLEIGAAVTRSKEIEARLESARVIEAQKQANLAQQAEENAKTAVEEAFTPEPVAEAPEPVALADVPEEALMWKFEVTCTRAQLATVIAFLKAEGIEGRAVR